MLSISMKQGLFKDDCQKTVISNDASISIIKSSNIYSWIYDLVSVNRNIILILRKTILFVILVAGYLNGVMKKTYW